MMLALAASAENITRPSHGQEITWSARIDLHFAAQARHLGVDRSIRTADPALLAELLAADRYARTFCQDLQERDLGGGQMNHGLAAGQLLPLEVIDEGTEA